MTDILHAVAPRDGDRGETPPIGVVVIGDELLSGRRQDRHLTAVIERLAPRGLRPDWARYVGDDDDRIAHTLRDSQAESAVVFCFGGIGATPDDRTRAVAAHAFGRPLVRHPGALSLIEQQFGAEAYPHRVLMADLPEGADLIPNPINRVPGFYLERHFFMPGFPQMAHPMLDWILAGPLAALLDDQYVEEAIWLPNVSESFLIDVMDELCAAYPELRLFSLPIWRGEQRVIELGFKGQAVRVADAMAELTRRVTDLGCTVVRERPELAPE